MFLSSDHQKLEREARICRLLKHPNIGKFLTPHIIAASGLCKCPVVAYLLLAS